MADRDLIKVMISSRSLDSIPFTDGIVELSVLRAQLKSELEGLELLGRRLFDVWIHEPAPPAGGDKDSWDHCLEEVRHADIVIALYNGCAGWAERGGGIGICHAELHLALTMAPAKVRVVELPLSEPCSADPAANERDHRFREYVRTQSRFRGGTVETLDSAKQRVRQALRDAVVEMVGLGVREARRGKFHTGDALDWSRLDFAARRRAMLATLTDSLSKQPASEVIGDHTIISLQDTPVLTILHAIPASMTTPGALDLTHHPFLRDHQYAHLLRDRRAGPLHLIACNRRVTESQAVKQLGFADAIVVATPFGVYVADRIQKIQLVFISDCRDDASTRHGVQRFFDWLDQTGEAAHLVVRAQARSRIVQLLADLQ